MIALLFLWLGLAHAARDVQVCGQWTPDLTTAGYLDGDGTDTNGDGILNNDVSDFLFDNTPLKTHGLLAELEYRQSVNPPLPQNAWSTGWTGYLTVAGPDGGCTPMVSLPVPAQVRLDVRLKVISKFQVPGHGAMNVLSDETNLLFTAHWSPTTVWLAVDDPRKTVAMGSGDSQIDIAIILAWALNREDGGATNMDWTIYNSSSTNGAGHTAPDTREIWVGEDTNVRRILHEFGHAIAFELTDWSKTYSWKNRENSGQSVCWKTPDDPPPADQDDGSTNHSSTSDEATSAAIVEGFATYYAAQTINRVDEGDCFIAEDSFKNWDHSTNGIEPTEQNNWYSCDVAPVPSQGLSDTDYWADVCGYPTGSPPTGDGYSIACEYDWLRGFWDLDTDYGWSFEDMLNVLVVANYAEWNVGWSYPLNDESNRAHRRMEIGAEAIEYFNSPEYDGLYDDWMTVSAANGMDR